jgi:hypothetical protein
MEEVTHAQIYERLVAVETKVDHIDKNTKDMVDGFNAVQGAFTVLGWIAKVAKPILWVAGAFTAASIFWANWKK